MADKKTKYGAAKGKTKRTDQKPENTTQNGPQEFEGVDSLKGMARLARAKAK